jgi:hypothetical protein
MNTNRRGFLGALLAAPFLAPKPTVYGYSDAWREFFEREYQRLESESRIQVARINTWTTFNTRSFVQLEYRPPL